MLFIYNKIVIYSIHIQIMSIKTVTRSFRISEESLHALEQEANSQKISINTLLNRVLRNFVEFDRYFEEFGMLKISRIAYRKTLTYLDDSELSVLAREIAQNSGEVFMRTIYGSISLDFILDWLEDLATFGKWFHFSEVRSNNGKRVITFTHDLGSKFSVFLLTYIKELLELVLRDVDITSTEDSVTVEI